MNSNNSTYEQDMERLHAIVERLSQGGLALDEMMRLYEEGVALGSKCRKTLDDYEAKLILIDRENGGGADV